jgi:hypothetical protein
VNDHERRLASIETRFARHEADHASHEARVVDTVRREAGDVFEGMKRLVDELTKRFGALGETVARIEGKTDDQTAMMVEAAVERGRRQEREATAAAEIEKHKARTTRLQAIGMVAVGLLSAILTWLAARGHH